MASTAKVAKVQKKPPTNKPGTAPDDARKQVAKVNKLMASWQEWEAENQEDLRFAEGAMKKVQVEIKAAEREKEVSVGPHYAAYTKALDLHQPKIKALKELLALIKERYQAGRNALRKTTEEAIAGAQDPATVAALVEATDPTGEGISEGFRWGWERTVPEVPVGLVRVQFEDGDEEYDGDLLAIDGIPPDYFLLDEKRLNREVRAMGDQHPLVKLGAIRAIKIDETRVRV